MSRKLVVLDSAKEEFIDIRSSVQRDFGDLTWNKINAEYKDASRLIKNEPDSGSPIVLLKDLGINNIKYRLVKQTRIVYEYDDRLILIHMFISTRRDFATHLLKRLFR